MAAAAVDDAGDRRVRAERKPGESARILRSGLSLRDHRYARRPDARRQDRVVGRPAGDEDAQYLSGEAESGRLIMRPRTRSRPAHTEDTEDLPAQPCPPLTSVPTVVECCRA